MDFTDIVGNNKSNGTSSLDDNDTLVTDLTLNNIESDLLKSSNDAEAVVTSSITIDSSDLQTSVNSTELEDVLLADDDLVTAANMDAENLTNPATVEEDVDKINAINSIMDAENERNMGDDLNTLLSKINDNVDNGMEGAANSDIREKIDPNELLSDIEKNMSSIESDTTDLPADLLEAVPQRNDEEKNVEYILIGEEEDQIVTKEPSDDPVKELQTMEVCEKVNELNANCKELLDEKEKESQSLESSTISDVKCSSGEMLTLENAEVEKSLNETGHAKLGKNIEKLEENKTVENEIKQDENFKATELEMITKETLHKSEERNEIVEENTQNHTKESNMENTELSVNKNDLELEKNEDDINNKEELDNNENDKQIIEIKVDDEEIKLTAVIMEEEASVVQRENIEAAEKLNSKDEIKQVEVVMEQKKEEINKSPKEPANHSDVSDVSDVIQLLDDKNDEADMSKQKNYEKESEKVQKQPETEFDKVKGSTKEGTKKENKCQDTGENLESTKAGPIVQPDNSNNACDKFTIKKPSEKEEAEKMAEKAEETNDNYNGGSNLLQEAKNIEHIIKHTSPAEADNEDDGEENYNENKNENENKNDLDDKEGDLEIIENETKETEEKSDETMPPPLKRQRLSMDNEETQVSMTKVDETATTGESELSSTAVVAQTEEDRSQKISDEKAENKNETTQNTTSFLKRSHEVNELEGDVEDETVESNKKVKTDDGLKSLTLVEDKKEIAELIGVPSHIQIALNPPPKLLNTSPATAKDSKLSLDFLKHFRKTFDKMTKQDLEEIFLPKVVEAIIHKSAFSEMREVIDKQEKIITSKKNITEAINRSTQTSPHHSGGLLAQQLISPQRPMTSTNISDNFTTLSTRTSNNAASSSLSSSLSAIAVQKNPETIAFIDLTDDDEAPPAATSMTLCEGGGVTQGRTSPAAANVTTQYNRPQVFNPAWKLPPPRPIIRICNLGSGIIIFLNMEESLEHYDECVKYQIYARQEPVGPPSADSWRHVGNVKAMPLPMAVTLKQSRRAQRYYFAVRAMDCHHRYGPFSLPRSWSQAKK